MATIHFRCRRDVCLKQKGDTSVANESALALFDIGAMQQRIARAVINREPGARPANLINTHSPTTYHTPPDWFSFRGKPDERLIIGRFRSQSVGASEMENRNAGRGTDSAWRGRGWERTELKGTGRRKGERNTAAANNGIKHFIVRRTRQRIDLLAVEGTV